MENFAVSVDWAGEAGVPITHVNQFVAQPGPPTSTTAPDGVFLLIGSIPPPFIPRNLEGQKHALERLKITGLKVDVHARYHMSRQRLEELIQVLQTTADTYDALAEKAANLQPEDDEED